MKFDLNKEFSFSQIGNYLKRKYDSAVKFIKKMDGSSIKNITVKGKVVRINAIRLSFIAAVLAVLLALFVNIVIVPNTTYRAYSDLEFDTGGQYIQYAFGKDVLLLNKSGVKDVNNKGGDVWNIKMTLTNPTIDIDGKYALLADLDGNNSLNLYDTNGNNIVSYPISTDILSAKINKKGYAVAALAEEGYKGTVVVFDKKANEVFKWNSGEGYITDVDISKDGKYVAVAQMMSDGDETYSKVRVMNTTNGQESGTAICEDTLIAKINFDKNSNITAVGQNKVFGFSKKGNKNFEIDLAGKSPVKYDVENGDNLLFLCRDSRGNSVLEIYSISGKYLGSYTSSDEIKNIASYNDNIIAATSRNLICLNYKGKLKKSIEISHDIMSIGIYGNERNVLVLGGNKADIVRIK